KPYGWGRPIRGATIKVVQHCPYLVATRGQATVIVLHLRQIAVASFHCRGRPLEGPGMLTCPRCPACAHLGREPPGARVPLKGALNPRECPCDLGLLLWTARACQLFLPVHQRQQQFLHPLYPPWGYRYVLQVVPHRLPPEIDQRRYTGKLLTDL